MTPIPRGTSNTRATWHRRIYGGSRYHSSSMPAKVGVLPQSRRHVYITSLLGIRQLVLAVNKMDLVDFSSEAFDRIEQQFAAFVAQLGEAEVKAIPLSALDGDNVVERSERMPWYSDPTLLEHLEECPHGTK